MYTMAGENSFLLGIYVSSSSGLIKNEIVEVNVDMRLCVISPWKENSEVP